MIKIRVYTMFSDKCYLKYYTRKYCLLFITLSTMTFWYIVAEYTYPVRVGKSKSTAVSIQSH